MRQYRSSLPSCMNDSGECQEVESITAGDWTSKTAFGGTSIRQLPVSTIILGVEKRFKNQVTTCSDFPSDAMLWIKQVEMVDSLEELNSSQSACGKNFPNFEMLDAKIFFCSEQDQPEFPVQEEVQSRGTESPERGPVAKGVPKACSQQAAADS